MPSLITAKISKIIFGDHLAFIVAMLTTVCCSSSSRVTPLLTAKTIHVIWSHHHMVNTIFPAAPGDSMMSWWAWAALSSGYREPTTGRSQPASIPAWSSAAHSLFSSWERRTGRDCIRILGSMSESFLLFIIDAYDVIIASTGSVCIMFNLLNFHFSCIQPQCIKWPHVYPKMCVGFLTQLGTGVAKKRATPMMLLSLAMVSLGLISTEPLEPMI